MLAWAGSKTHLPHQLAPPGCNTLTTSPRRQRLTPSRRDKTGSRRASLSQHVHVLFLPEIGFSLLHCGHVHVADAGRRQLVEAGLGSLDGDDVEVLSSGFVGAVHRSRHRDSSRRPASCTTSTPGGSRPSRRRRRRCRRQWQRRRGPGAIVRRIALGNQCHRKQ